MVYSNLKNDLYKTEKILAENEQNQKRRLSPSAESDVFKKFAKNRKMNL